ncbi:MAG: hypothetical protein ABH811_00855 [archaeon]
MKTENLSEKFPALKLENLKNLGECSNQSLVNFGKERIDSLKKSIDELNLLIGQRENLSKDIFNEGEKIKNEITNFLLSNKAEDVEDHKERNGLRQKQIEISELQLNEKVNCWRDVSQLKKELRENQKELIEKEDHIKMLNDILE